MLTQAEKCASCCRQISIAEHYIVFDAKLTRQNHTKKKTLLLYIFMDLYIFKANFESPLKTYLVIDNVENVIVNMPT